MKRKYIVFCTLIAIYLGVLLYYIISLYQTIQDIPINDILNFVNKISDNINIDNIIQQINGNFSLTVQHFNNQMNNLNRTFYHLIDNIDYFRDVINEKMIILDNLNQTAYIILNNIQYFNSSIGDINGRLISIEDNIETILYNTNPTNPTNPTNQQDYNL